MVAKTLELIEAHPLNVDLIVEVVQESWKSILDMEVGHGFRIGKDIFPSPQAMGLLLHELIPLEFERLLPGKVCASRKVSEKDLVYIDDDQFSCEIKTSSSPKQIFANRSYAIDQSSAGRKVEAPRDR